MAPARFLDAEFRYTLLYAEPVRLYCGKPHPLHGREFAKPEDLADEGLILTASDEPDLITRYRLQHGLGRVVAGQSEHLNEARRLTIQGVGLCFLPEPFVSAEVADQRLWPLLPDAQSFTSDIYVAFCALARAATDAAAWDVLGSIEAALGIALKKRHWSSVDGLPCGVGHR